MTAFELLRLAIRNKEIQNYPALGFFFRFIIIIIFIGSILCSVEQLFSITDAQITFLDASSLVTFSFQ